MKGTGELVIRITTVGEFSERSQLKKKNNELLKHIILGDTSENINVEEISTANISNVDLNLNMPLVEYQKKLPSSIAVNCPHGINIYDLSLRVKGLLPLIMHKQEYLFYGKILNPIDLVPDECFEVNKVQDDANAVYRARLVLVIDLDRLEDYDKTNGGKSSSGYDAEFLKEFSVSATSAEGLEMSRPYHGQKKRGIGHKPSDFDLLEQLSSIKCSQFRDELTLLGFEDYGSFMHLTMDDLKDQPGIHIHYAAKERIVMLSTALREKFYAKQKAKEEEKQELILESAPDRAQVVSDGQVVQFANKTELKRLWGKVKGAASAVTDEKNTNGENKTVERLKEHVHKQLGWSTQQKILRLRKDCEAKKHSDSESTNSEDLQPIVFDEVCCHKHLVSIFARRSKIEDLNKMRLVADLDARFNWIQRCGHALAPLDCLMEIAVEVLQGIPWFSTFVNDTQVHISQLTSPNLSAAVPIDGCAVIDKDKLRSEMSVSARLTLDELNDIEFKHCILETPKHNSLVPLIYYSKRKFARAIVEYLDLHHPNFFFVPVSS